MLLLGLELLGTAGFFLGIASSAVVVGLFVWLFDSFGVVEQLLLFAGLSLIYSWLYFQFFRKRTVDETDNRLLNNRAAQLVGTVVEASAAVQDGAGRIAIGDTLWSVRVEGDVAEGEKVRVTGADGMDLLIEKA